MKNFGVKFLEHDIPKVLRVRSNVILAFRVQNTLHHPQYFYSHTSFYGTPTNERRLHLYILLDGKFFKTITIDNNCLPPLKRTTLYFPFRADAEGECRIEVVLAEQDDNTVPPAGTFVLFAQMVAIKRPVPDLLRIARHVLFTLRHTGFVIGMSVLKMHLYKLILGFGHLQGERKKQTLRQYKEANRRLSFLEQQTRRLRVASLPCYLGIDTTSKCNLRCAMCFRQHVDTDFNSIPDMPTQILDTLVKDLFPTALTLNLSSLGEPLLSTHVKKILQACSDYQVYLSITTNGTLLRKDHLVRQIASVLHYMEISVDSASPDRFERYRSGARFAQVIQNAAKLGDIRRGLPDPKFSLGFSMTLFRENLAEIPDLLDIVSEIGGNFLKTDIGVIFTKRDLNQSVLTCPAFYNEIYEVAHEKARQNGIRLLMRPPFSESSQTKGVRYGVCDYLYLSACIKSVGTLNPCYFAPLSSTSVRNGFREAWNGEMMQQLRLNHDTDKSHPLCKDCYMVLEGSDSVENRQKQFLKGEVLASLG